MTVAVLPMLLIWRRRSDGVDEKREHDLSSIAGPETIPVLSRGRFHQTPPQRHLLCLLTSIASALAIVQPQQNQYATEIETRGLAEPDPSNATANA